MSHITKQLGVVSIQEIDKISRACQAIFEQELGCSLKLDMDRKECRYYGTRKHKCDGVITFARKLSSDEKNRFYEIGLEKVTDDTGTHYIANYDVSAGDRGMKQRWERIQGAYQIERLKDQGIADGWVISGQTEVAPGKFELELQKGA